ncbi:hypothetical protein MZ909_07505 [Thermosynechococcus sp. B0]|nr:MULTISPECIES: hypothetical protein [unclassified Thermosynechococcus]WJI23074.1 hypothetical protein MZ909_07505 [Thermosynechococcus sp. B0]WKT82678.1 hypothetical protein QYC28_07520 [Thermosynechococcus sp. HY596]WNC61804.1 hypothetical protein RHK13_07515 [Thermosynechococcus sp. HY591]
MKLTTYPLGFLSHRGRLRHRHLRDRDVLALICGFYCWAVAHFWPSC